MRRKILRIYKKLNWNDNDLHKSEVLPYIKYVGKGEQSSTTR